MAVSPTLARFNPSRKIWFSLAATAALTFAAVIPISQANATTIPANTGSIAVPSTISVSKSTPFDGGMKRYYGIDKLGTGDQAEGGAPIFDLPAGGTIRNVIIGTPGADGIHCEATCTLENVWWEDVGEDAATFIPTSTSATMTIKGGGALHASDKVFQHNGVGGTFIIDGFQVQDFGKLYRSCGNCKSAQGKRTVIVKNSTATYKGSAIVGINTNYGDTATITNLTIIGDSSKKIKICNKYIGNQTGAEPTSNGSGADGTYCKYTDSEIHYK